MAKDAIQSNPWKTMVTVMLPRGAKKDEAQFVCINGRSFMVPMGKQVEVPEPVYEVLMTAQAADERARERKEELAGQQE